MTIADVVSLGMGCDREWYDVMVVSPGGSAYSVRYMAADAFAVIRSLLGVWPDLMSSTVAVCHRASGGLAFVMHDDVPPVVRQNGERTHVVAAVGMASVFRWRVVGGDGGPVEIASVPPESSPIPF